MIILFLAGIFIGYQVRARRAKMAETESGQRIVLLDQQIAQLNQRIAAMLDAESRRRDETERRRRQYEENDVSDINNQIRFISQTQLRAVRPVNKEAARVVLYPLNDWMNTNHPDWRMSFEVGMGAFIKTSYDPEDPLLKAAFSSYNSKRVDFLLIDKSGKPMLVVEYHGTGHDLSEDAPDRMHVKRLALSRAGIPLVEVPANTTKQEFIRMIDAAFASCSRSITPVTSP
ncbi:DUF2726 domain-containing protein [Burkholderia contaminans]|uniref:DUF2726 domain-containing protein n=1 Tax=Burkholderia contaminans TaxID=488447 RepID=UPI003116B85D